MISLTEKAVNNIVSIMKEQKVHGESVVRVGVKGGGCSGFEYKLDLWPKEEGDDPSKYNNYDYDGFNLLVDKKAELYIDGTTLDWYEDQMKQGFKFDNPNAVKTCGCGSSFGIS